MKLIKQTAYLLFFALTLVACKKEDVPPDENAFTSVFVPKNDYYFPVEPGWKWCYDGDYTYCTEVSSKTKEINGNTAYEFNASGGNESEGWGRMDAEGRGSTIAKYPYQDDYGNVEYYDYFELKFFNGADSIGTEHITQAMSNSYTTNTYTMTLEKKGLSRVVNKVKYNDVMRVKLTTHTYAALGDFVFYDQIVVTQYYFLAKGVGLIESITDQSVPVNVKLTSYVAPK